MVTVILPRLSIGSIISIHRQWRHTCSRDYRSLPTDVWIPKFRVCGQSLMRHLLKFFIHSEKNEQPYWQIITDILTSLHLSGMNFSSHFPKTAQILLEKVCIPVTLPRSANILRLFFIQSGKSCRPTDVRNKSGLRTDSWGSLLHWWSQSTLKNFLWQRPSSSFDDCQ